jgi:hypothetical protein
MSIGWKMIDKQDREPNICIYLLFVKLPMRILSEQVGYFLLAKIKRTMMSSFLIFCLSIWFSCRQFWEGSNNNTWCHHIAKNETDTEEYTRQRGTKQVITI